MRDQLMWATATGLLCFVSQLVAIEFEHLCRCSLWVAHSSWAPCLTRNAWALVGIEVAVATLAAANIALVLFFKMTSADYVLMFDYRTIPSNSFAATTAWAHCGSFLPRTVILIVATAFVIGKCIVSARSLDPLDASLFVSIGFVSLVWLKSAFINSDVHTSAPRSLPWLCFSLCLRQQNGRRSIPGWRGDCLVRCCSHGRRSTSPTCSNRRQSSDESSLEKLYAPGKDPAGGKPARPLLLCWRPIWPLPIRWNVTISRQSRENVRSVSKRFGVRIGAVRSWEISSRSQNAEHFRICLSALNSR